jgi:hypothetical protein
MQSLPVLDTTSVPITEFKLVKEVTGMCSSRKLGKPLFHPDNSVNWKVTAGSVGTTGEGGGMCGKGWICRGKEIIPKSKGYNAINSCNSEQHLAEQ